MNCSNPSILNYESFPYDETPNYETDRVIKTLPRFDIQGGW